MKDIVREKEREEKWKRRGKAFWNAFLITENGKPKSSFFIYTFCLSVLYLLLYIFAYGCIIPLLTGAVAPLPIWLGNLIIALIVSAVVLFTAWILHRLMKDKRLMFGTYMWLLVYGIAALITILIFLRNSAGDIPAFLNFFVWFFGIPLITGVPTTYYWTRRDYVPRAEPEPEWKNYVNRR